MHARVRQTGLPAPTGLSVERLEFAPLEQELHARVAELSEALAHTEARYRGQLAESRRSAQRLERVLSALPAAVVVIDGAGRVAELNGSARALFGDVDGCPWARVAADAFSPGQGDASHLRLRDGRSVTLSTRPLDGEPGQILLFNDVTEQVAVEANLKRQQRLLDVGRMAATLAHQVRTPLASALLYASHLTRPGLEAGQRARFAERLLGGLRRLERLVTDMLVFSRSGGVGQAEAVAVDALIDEVIEQVGPEARRAGATLRRDGGTGGERLWGNPTMLASALGNLVVNAVQAAPGSEVVVGARPKGRGYTDLYVRDHGPGISREEQSRIFEPFESRRGDGNGLGLAVVRAVARAHDGDAWVASTEGEGSTFGMRLPSADAAGSGDADVAAAVGE